MRPLACFPAEEEFSVGRCVIWAWTCLSANPSNKLVIRHGILSPGDMEREAGTAQLSVSNC